MDADIIPMVAKQFQEKIASATCKAREDTLPYERSPNKMPEKRDENGMTRQDRWKAKQGEKWRAHRRRYMKQYAKTGAAGGLAKLAARGKI